jgi:hypothetical protein
VPTLWEQIFIANRRKSERGRKMCGVRARTCEWMRHLMNFLWHLRWFTRRWFLCTNKNYKCAPKSSDNLIIFVTHILEACSSGYLWLFLSARRCRRRRRHRVSDKRKINSIPAFFDLEALISKSLSLSHSASLEKLYTCHSARGESVHCSAWHKN